MAINVYEMVTNRIISELEKGVIPWEKPWSGSANGAFNRITGKPYSFINQMLLTFPGEYATFKQWQSLGGHVKKGEKAEIVVFWKMYQKELDEIDPKTGKKKVKNIPTLKYYNVFHISQVEGVEPLEVTPATKEIQTNEDADNIIKGYLNREKVKFEEIRNNRAYYSPLSDSVVVPEKSQFPEIEEWYSTAFHELTHSTGHRTRLNRLTTGKAAAFGSETYSKEELVAEIGAASIMNLLGMETKHSFRNSAAYIQSWLRVLKDDTKMIVSASSRAQKAVELIIG